MPFKKILTAASLVAVLAGAGATAANAEPFRAGFHDGRGHMERAERRIVEHRVVFDTLRVHRIRFVGDPYFVRGHYVVRSFDRLGHARFVEVNPYTGAFVGFIRL